MVAIVFSVISMADNYLENRMEEYRAGRLAPKARIVRSSKSPDKNELRLKYPPLNVAVFGGAFPFVEEIVKGFRSVDCSVAVCHADSKCCSLLAQKSGCRYYPFDPTNQEEAERVIDDIVGHWGAVDVVIDLRAVSIESPSDGIEDMAMLLLVHSHPRFAFVGMTEIVGVVE